MKLMLLIFLVLGFIGCATSSPKDIVFPDLQLGNCPTENDRLPSSLCKTDLGGDDMPHTNDPLEMFVSYSKRKDFSVGMGLRNANHYLPDQVESILQGSPDKSFWARGQVVEFYQHKNNKTGTAIYGTPTRVYLTGEGEIAYLAFDNQAVSLLEVRGRGSKLAHFQIPGQGQVQHGEGFSSPVGKIKGLADYPNRYTADELGIFIGKPGQRVRLEFESGVVVTGVLDKYTTSTLTGNEGKVTAITFVNKSCEVTYGLHKLFKKEWGVFDMLLMPEISNSLSLISLGSQ